MDLVVNNSSTNSTENVMHKLPNGQKEYQSQVRDLIKELGSWRDELHSQISNIISSHIRITDKGFNDLVDEFTDLQTQVSVLRKVNDVLRETVDNLNSGIRLMGAKLPFAEPEVQEGDGFEADIPDIKEDVESPRVQSETDDEARCVAYGDILDQSTHTQNKISISDDQSTPQL